MTRARIAVATVLTVLCAIVVVLFANRDDNPRESGTAAPRPTRTAPGGPSSAGGFDDPTTDRLGRKIIIPRNAAGQPQPQRDPGPRVECGGGAVDSPQGMQIQRSFEMPILTSATDGPTRIEGTNLLGYRRSPQGAAIAGFNFLSRTYAAGEPSRAAIAALTILTEDEQRDLAQASAPVEADPAGDRFRRLFLAPEAFRILTCDADLVAVEWALRAETTPATTTAAGQWVGLRLNLLWRHGDWRVQLARELASTGAGQRDSSLEGWTKWSW
ncbi:hypothetical protein [Nocardia suismassiliense]|uniref:hypothetical protein n=1 Tax=Nocardia suismassiliense TaxID=2077092 RepID=UPI000D1E093A|nr:hypothetical protein [Nocardia suismassiliense]